MFWAIWVLSSAVVVVFAVACEFRTRWMKEKRRNERLVLELEESRHLVLTLTEVAGSIADERDAVRAKLRLLEEADPGRAE